MKNYLLLIFAFISLFSIGQDKKCDCAKFATGTYYMEPDGKSEDTLFIIRTATTQTEIQGEDYKKVHNITWLAPCKMIIHTPNTQRTKKLKSRDLIVKFIETGSNYYKVKAWFPGGKKLYFTIYVYNP